MEEAKTTTIRATNRMSVKIKDNYFTVEWSEERSIPDDMSEEWIAKERARLWNTCIQECENQIQDIVRTYRG